jgi:hypothetical protein
MGKVEGATMVKQDLTKPDRALYLARQREKHPPKAESLQTRFSPGRKR